MTLSSVVFRNMSSEPTPPPAPQPRPRRRQAGAADQRQQAPGRDAAPSAADLASALGYDPDDPATWPGSERRPAAGPGGAEEAGEATGLPVSESAPLTDPLAMRALAHPVRIALIELLAVADTLTATQASELLGESPANCAFHLRTLAKYGFVHEAGGGRGRERPWKAADRNITLSTKQDDPRAAIAAGEVSRIWLDRWMERARQVFALNVYPPGWEHATGWSQSAVFLTSEETEYLRRQMRHMLKQYEDRKSHPALRPAGALPVEWTIFAAPVPELAGLAEAQAREAQAREAAGHQADPDSGSDA